MRSCKIPLEILDKYFVIATLLMPAIIMITIRRWITPINWNFFQDIYKFVGYGMFNFIVFGGLAKLNNWNLIDDVFKLGSVLGKPFHYLSFTIFLPILLGLLLALIDRLHIMNYILGTIFRKNIETNSLTTWEEFFAENPKGEINVTLNCGTQIIGDFKKPSRVSSSIKHKDLWISKVKRINNHYFNKEVSMWINGNDVKYIILNENNIDCKNLIIELLSNIFKAIGLKYKILKDISKNVNDIAKSIKEKEKNHDKGK